MFGNNVYTRTLKVIIFVVIVVCLLAATCDDGQNYRGACENLSCKAVTETSKNVFSAVGDIIEDSMDEGGLCDSCSP